MEELAERRRQKEAERQSQRQEGIEYLKANVGTLEIGDHAKDGRVLTNIDYLRKQVARKSKNSARWSVAGWRQLEKEFGPAVARAFHDYCVKYWRLYQPQLRSEIGRDTNQTPGAVVVGLSGLAMEAAGDRSWTKKLSKDEAALATRYALWELNGLPGWFGALFEAHSEAVKEVLVGEMAWELTQPRANNSAGYVFSRLRWTSVGLGKALRAEILSLLEKYPEADATALGEALTVVLRYRDPLPLAFAEMAAQRAIAAESDDVKALWLSALLCVAADKALEILEEWIADGTEAAVKELRLSLVLEHVWGDSFHGLSSEHQSFHRADLLVRLIKLSHVHIDPDKDTAHEGVFSPGLRYDAQDARDQLVKILCELPGKDTYHGLLELSEFAPKEYPRDRMLVLAERRAEADTEHDRWAAEDVQSFAVSAEYGPRSQKELYELALSRLDDIKLELEEGDESEASLLQRTQDEVELRRVIANRLRRSAGGKYTTGSEEELADASRTDIRLHHPDVDARVPIELKIADAAHWTPAKLRQMLEEQLTAQYMLELRYGVYLLVRRGGPNDQPVFRIDGKDVSSDELADWLRREGQELVKSNASLDGIEIVTIDLTKRSRRSDNKRASRRSAALMELAPKLAPHSKGRGKSRQHTEGQGMAPERRKVGLSRAARKRAARP